MSNSKHNNNNDDNEEEVSVYSTSEHIHMAFLKKEPVHPIDVILENRSWMNVGGGGDSKSVSGRTDDDGLRYEEEMVRQSEQLLAQELEGAVLDLPIMDHQHHHPSYPQPPLAPQPRNYYNYNYATDQKNNHKQHTTNHIVRMDEIDLDMIERDAAVRSTTGSSFPSDEARFLNDDDDEQESSSVPALPMKMTSTSEVSPTTPTVISKSYSSCVQVVDDATEIVEYKPLESEDHSSLGKAVAVEDNNDKHDNDDYTHVESSVVGISSNNTQVSSSQASSEWKLGSSFRNATSIDLESGGGQSDIFQQDGFWHDGLWRSHFPNHNHTAESGRESRQDYVSSVSEEEDNSLNNDVNYSPIQQRQDVDRPSQPDESSMFNVVKSLPEQVKDGEYWAERRQHYDYIDVNLNYLHNPTSQQYFGSTIANSTVGHSPEHDNNPRHQQYDKKTGSLGVDAVISEPLETIIQDDDDELNKSHRKCCSRQSLFIFATHILLIVGGIVSLVLCLQQSSTQPPVDENVAVLEIPSNDLCNATTVEPILETSTTFLQGTLLGATQNKNPCHANTSTVRENQVGVWYATIGTGSYLRVSINPENHNAVLGVSIFIGSCSNLQCMTSNNTLTLGSQNTATVTTSSWFSEAGELYYIFVHSISVGSNTSFTISLQDNNG
jgi:hypothetical protein